MGALVEQFRMETNFKGLIKLLAESLYPEPDVFVRELIQNAHDAIMRRLEADRSLAGRIDIEIDDVNKTITFLDNGIGMDRQDIKEFLAVIGSTGTGDARQQLKEQGKAAALQLIGQFGIGLLSAFVVAERIVVRTRKLGASEAFAWHNSGSIECELFADDKPDVGSEVVVHVASDFRYMLGHEKIRDIIIRYCDFIPIPIHLNGAGPVNVTEAPWDKVWGSDAEREAAYKQYLNRRFPDVPLDVIPILIDQPFKARGAMHISDRHVPDLNTTGVMDIFVRRMFVRAQDNTLLPPWAKFVRGIIDSPDLQPTAARDNIQRNHQSFEFLQKRLGELIIERLTLLARTQPKRFAQINAWHHYHLKGMALFHDDFFASVIELLLFETNKGQMSLRDYLTKNRPRPETGNKAPVYYFAHYQAAAQFYRLADAKGWVVINAGLRFEEELLEKYGQRNGATVHLERLDATDDKELFARPTPEEAERFRELERDLEFVLNRMGVGNIIVRIRRFDPPELPAVIVMDPESQAQVQLRNLVNQPWFAESFENITREAIQQIQRRPFYLSLNIANPLVQRLNDQDRDEGAIQEVMLALYNTAVLYSHNLLTQHNSDVLHTQFLRLCERTLDLHTASGAARRELEEKRRQELEAAKQHDAVARPEHTRVFMITPFSEKYKPLEEAIRRVFERHPFYFEVKLARDSTHMPNLMDDLRTHMRAAHGFVADISELNPNVMLELGAVMFSDDDRPYVCLRGNEAVKLPADLEGIKYVVYGSLAEGAEALENRLRSELFRDGKLVHEGLQELLARRTKRFLSRLMLQHDISVRLQAGQMDALMRSYATVEELLDVEPVVCARAAGIKPSLVMAIQAELRGDEA